VFQQTRVSFILIRFEETVPEFNQTPRHEDVLGEWRYSSIKYRFMTLQFRAHNCYVIITSHEDVNLNLLSYMNNYKVKFSKFCFSVAVSSKKLQLK
jgi:hypothetical protein